MPALKSISAFWRKVPVSPNGPFITPACVKPKALGLWKIFLAPVLLWFLGFTGAHAQLFVGDSGSLSVTFTSGLNTWSGVTITSNVPSDFTFVSCGGGVPCADNGGVVTWDVGTVGPGQSIVVYNFVNVSSCASTAVTILSVITTSSPATVINAPPEVYSVNCVPATPTASPTITNTPTVTFTPTITSTPTLTGTPTSSPTITFTPTITPTPLPNLDFFYISKNIFNPDKDGPVSINVQYSKFPGEYDLWVYNTAGEHIKTIDHQNLSGVLNQSYSWDGTNKYGAKCASGVYIFYLIEPFEKQQKRILLVR
jgi:hypothetical protein